MHTYKVLSASQGNVGTTISKKKQVIPPGKNSSTKLTNKKVNTCKKILTTSNNPTSLKMGLIAEIPKEVTYIDKNNLPEAIKAIINTVTDIPVTSSYQNCNPPHFKTEINYRISQKINCDNPDIHKKKTIL